MCVKVVVRERDEKPSRIIGERIIIVKKKLHITYKGVRENNNDDSAGVYVEREGEGQREGD